MAREPERQRLHLGCGQQYLEGYRNIDFPPDAHSVQAESVADDCADLRELRFAAGSVQEVRLHHVFEHFRRPVACALLGSWHTWLCPGGTLHLEVPDFGRTAAEILKPWSSARAKAVAERHLFGSHEAEWAAHYEGYTPALLKTMVTAFDFETVRVAKNAWHGTFNVELIARRGSRSYGLREFREMAEGYLKVFLVDETPSEIGLLEVWLDEACRQAEIGGVAAP